MLSKQKTREGEGAFAGSRTGDLENNRQEEGSNFPPASQGKCVRCPYFAGKGYACNLPVCPFPVRQEQRLDLRRRLRQSELPQIHSVGERHLFTLPRGERTFARKSFAIKLPARGVSSGR